MDKKPKTLNFEKAMKDLETLVSELENRALPLEKSLKLFEKGIQLTRHCQSELNKAEQKVQMLTENNELVDFDSDVDHE